MKTRMSHTHMAVIAVFGFVWGWYTSDKGLEEVFWLTLALMVIVTAVTLSNRHRKADKSVLS